MSKDLGCMARRLPPNLWRAGAIVLLFLFSPPGAAKNVPLSSVAPAVLAVSGAPPISFDANSPASISYTFAVDKAQPEVNDSLVYTLTVWNDPLQSDTLRAVEAEFDLPRLENGSFALQVNSFHDAGPHPFVIDEAQGKITWQLGDIIRHAPPLPGDTVRLVFSFRLAAVSSFSLSCGANPITALARVSFVNEEGRRIFPGTPRAAESTLFLTPDFVAERLIISPQQVQIGDTLTLQYFFRNDGNVGRQVALCFDFPPGLDSGLLLGVSPDSIGIPAVLTGSLCLHLGFVPAGAARSIELRILAIAPAAPPLDLLCFNGRLQTDCDIQPENNFFQAACATLVPLDLLAVEKRGSLPRLRAGDSLRYTIDFSNRALSMPAWHVTIADTLPPGVDFISATPPYQLANGILTWQRAQLPAGARDSVHVAVRLRPDFFANNRAQACRGANITNTATIASTAFDGSPSPESPLRLQNNRATHVAFVEPWENLLALAVQTGSAVLPGEEFSLVLQASNVSDLDAEAVAINQILAPPFEIIAIDDSGAAAAPNQIRWEIGTLPARQTRSVSARARVRDSVYCAPASTSNPAWLQSATADCITADDTARAIITLLPTPPQQQPRLLAVNARARDLNGDGCAEPGERILAQVTIVNSNTQNLTAQQIEFHNPCAWLAGNCTPLSLRDLSPSTLAPGDSAAAVFEFAIRENIFSAQTIMISFEIQAAGFCPQHVADLPLAGLRYCPQPEVVLRLLDLNDMPGNGDGLASENEPLNLIAVAQNTGPLPADSVDLFLSLAPLGFAILQSNKAIPAGMPMHWRMQLPPGERDSLFLQFQYENFPPQEAVVAASAHLQISALAGPQPPRSDQLAIHKDCYARPNPFIPARHAGVEFAPNDGQRVEIFDLQGNLTRALIAPGPWDGRDERGRLCDPGLYIWKIENECQGAIVVVR